jgi:phosphoribosylformimino-5-aminoimidazole carboxamide ribotide isomerase
MTGRFTIFPAIDLRAGKVVRLAQGDPQRQTLYGDNPRLWAERWQSEGAEWLHVINLDGAFDEDASLNMQAVKAILEVGLNVELGGGMRDQASIETALNLGIRRIFLGTAAIQTPALVDWAIATYGPACIAGDIGSRNNRVTIKGWQETTSLSIQEVGTRLHSQRVEWCVLTNVKRDGVSSGVDIASAVELQNATGLKVVASGGVTSAEDVLRAHEAGLAGIIIGRALYEGKLSLAECLKQQAVNARMKY